MASDSRKHLPCDSRKCALNLRQYTIVPMAAHGIPHSSRKPEAFCRGHGPRTADVSGRWRKLRRALVNAELNLCLTTDDLADVLRGMGNCLLK